MSKNEETALSEEKVRKIAVGATVAGVLLLLFLLIVLIIQFVQMGMKRRDEARLDELIAQATQEKEDGEADLDDILNGFRLLDEAIDYGYKYQDR